MTSDQHNTKSIPENELERIEVERRNFALIAEISRDFIGMCDMAGVPFYANHVALELVGLDSFEQMRSTNLRDYFFPEDQDFILNDFLPRVLRDGRAEVDIRLRHFISGDAVWMRYGVFLLRNAAGEPSGFGTISRDITEAKRERDALRESEESLKDAQTRLEAALMAGEIATWTFDIVNDSVVADVNLARLFSVSVDDAAGGKLDPYLQAIHPDDRPRVTDAIADAVNFRDRFESEYRVVFPDGSVRWLVARGKIERDDTGQAIALPGVVVDITDRIEREQREKFLIALAERIQKLDDPDEIIKNAVNSLGEFLNLSRCALADIDIDADICSVPFDYRSDASVASIVGSFPISAFGGHLISEFRAGRAVAVDDVRAAPDRVDAASIAAYDGFDIRSYIAAPVVHSSRTVSCIACHCNTVRNWKQEDIDLVRSVVDKTWLTVEVVRQRLTLQRTQSALLERERNIASQLQVALQPELPGTLPGLALRKHYEAALNESSVGGDFYDVFTIDKGSTILVVGDLSGKGLAAASQVSTVRNMLRAFLYTRPSILEAVTDLNFTLSSNNLLTGFATLFVGCFDSAARTLTYVNCGQEPALHRKAMDGSVEMLLPTGPILGSLENAHYAEAKIRLASRDALAIFSDGLTEVGPSRQSMIGVEGVAELLCKCIPGETDKNAEELAESLAQRIIRGVDEAAKDGVMRDDVSLLVAVVE